MKRPVPFLALAAIVVSAAMLAGAWWLWSDAQAARREMAAAVALLRESRPAEKTAPRLAGPADGTGWDFNGTPLSDEAWKLSREDTPPAAVIPARLTETGEVPSSPSSAGESDTERATRGVVPPLTDGFKAERNRAAYLLEAAESSVLHRGDLQNVRPATLVEPKPAPSPPGSE